MNCIWDTLTVREHLNIIGAMKGLNGKDLEEVVEYYLQSLTIKEHSEKKSSTLSGGNKRKLCIAMCLMGSSDILYFDEPSTGIDPLARRFLWFSL